MKLTIHEVMNATKGILIQGNDNKIIEGISTDSRSIRNNDLFIPIVGEMFDGHDFIQSAINQNPICILVNSSYNKCWSNYKDLVIIQVKDTLKGFHDIARYYKSKFNIPTIAVTGSTGKTTTKEMIYEVLSQKYKVLKNKGNFNNHIGLPKTVFELDQSHEIAIFEMGMSGFGEIDTLASIVKPDVSVISNIGLSHIEHLGSQENIRKAKMEVVNYFDESSTLIINGDDLFLQEVKENHNTYKCLSIGFEDDCDFRAIIKKDMYAEGIIFEVDYNQHKETYSLKVAGKHNVYNALCAIAVGILFKVDIESITKAISSFEGSDMRLHVKNAKNNITIIDDTYNASPDSMKAAINVLGTIAPERTIAVLGDMLEMGEYAKAGHYNVGCEVGKNNLDLLITVGKESENIKVGAIKNGLEDKNAFSCKENKEVIKILEKILKENDTILVKGSRGMKMEQIVHYIQERS
ncbi:UDP-N-acetylmuramoyl-tripeptide--D-alanyl-D-alanine ligase [Lutibacter sp. B2]|nr:UDP-N-acetylmuramoyl-tripeptide--D-alanyl-D-alanine ligase [Lutibacter sp. B2]